MILHGGQEWTLLLDHEAGFSKLIFGGEPATFQKEELLSFLALSTKNPYYKASISGIS